MEKTLCSAIAGTHVSGVDASRIDMSLTRRSWQRVRTYVLALVAFPTNETGVSAGGRRR